MTHDGHASAPTSLTDTMWGPLSTPVHTAIPELDSVDYPWRDNAFLSWWDVNSGVCGIVHVSTSPNSGGRRARVSVAVPGRVHEIIEPLDAGSFDSPSVTVDLQRDTHVQHPELSVTLQQEPLYSPIDFTTSRAVPGLSDEYPLNHYQHVVRARGTCTVAGESHNFNGLGWRDRTWGFRDESVSWVDYTCACITLDDHAIVLYKVIDPSGQMRARAWQIDDGGQHELGEFSFVRNASGLLAEAAWETASGHAAVTTTRPLGGFWNPLGPDRHEGPTCSVYDEFLELRTNADAPASALVEHGIIRNVT